MADMPIDPGSRITGDTKCPICQRASDLVLRPFCSKRCADVDLHRWLAGAYAIPIVENQDNETGGDDDGASEI